MLYPHKTATIAMISFMLSACGGGGSDDSAPTPQYGYFIDTGVEGLSYQSPTFQGLTEGNGRFEYHEGETVEFRVLGLSIGSAQPTQDAPIVTPATLLNQDRSASAMATYLATRSSDPDAQAITNRLVLLQSLDQDGNLENGITLPTANSFAGEIDDYSNHFSGLDLNANSDDFRNNALTYITTLPQYNTRQLVTEENAIAHFIGALEDIEALTDFVGRWHMRSGNYGDLSAVYTFSDSGSVDVLEYDNCPAALWGSTESLLNTFCTEVSISQTFSSNGNQIELINEDFTDTCLPISITSHEALMSCNFFGSGLGTETIRLQRAPTNFLQAPVIGSYRELTPDSNATTLFTFEGDESSGGTGNYSGNQSSNFDWSKTSSALSVTPTGDASETFNFLGYLKGSWLIGLNTTNNINSILRSTNNTTNGNLLKLSGFVAVYDANPSGDGSCKEVRYMLEENQQVKLYRYPNASGVDYQCDYPRNPSIFDIGDGTPVTEPLADPDTISFSSTAMTISGQLSDRYCFLLGTDDYTLDNYYVACSNETGSGFDLEIWKGL